MTQRLLGSGMLLVVSRPGEPELTFPLGAGTKTLGRALTCDIVVDSPTVSHEHAVVMEQNGAYILRDQGSATGIYSAGRRVAEALLAPDDPAHIPDPYGNPITLTVRPAGQDAYTIPAPGTDQLHITHHLDAHRPVLTIGRDPDNDVTLDLPLVSRHHARVERHGAGALVRDRGSTNGTYVNGTLVRGVQPLTPGDEIMIGSTRFVFTGPTLRQFRERTLVRLDAVGLVRRAGWPGRTVILDDVSLSILPQEFVALVGGSGTGKSTLLNALNGTAPAQKGIVLYNGHDFYRAPGPYRGMIGFVPQDDILHRDLPVDRALDYAARLRLPPDTSPEERAQRIGDVLADVKMKSKRHELINKLSGGQRKRVSIAVELLADPNVLFLDEPTSGLDPGLDKTVMELLRELSDKGPTIVLVTHVTQNINLCDLVAFVAGRGHLVYYGRPADAPTFLGVQSFPEIYSIFDQDADDTATDTDKDKGDAKAIEKKGEFRASAHYIKYVLDRSPADAAPVAAAVTAPPAPLSKRQTRAAAWRQWRILTQRYGEILWRDRVNLALLLTQAPIVALLLTLVAHPDSYTPPQFFRTEQLLLMLTLAAIWFGTINAAREIVKERPIYLRERTVNLRIWPYVLSKFAVLSALAAIQSLLLLPIVSAKTPHLPPQGILLPTPLELYVTLALTSLAGIAAGLLISSLVSSADRAMSIVPVVLIAQIIFSGGVFDLQGVPDLLSWLSISRWCLSALGTTVDLNGLADRSGLPHDGWPKVMFSSPDPAHLLWNWLVLALFSAVLLLGTCATLRRRDARIG